ncbi:MAG: glycosyl transferase family protein [Sphingomonadaceae bacterium]
MLLNHELLLFAAVFFLIGALDELFVDLAYGWARLTGRAKSRRIVEEQLAHEPLRGRCAVFIPAWREDRVIGDTIRHALGVWRDEKLRLYVGCYSGDNATIAAAMSAAAGDPRLRIVVHDIQGPTCKADCLNRLYRALQLDEQRFGRRVRMVVLQDAEDMVDPAALSLLDRGMEEAEFIQLPVLALPQSESPWISGHYSDEFAESHAKTMVVRETFGAAIPGAGVGCAIDRVMLERLDRLRAGEGPFAAGSLTEDYELGQLVPALGGETKYLRARTADGRLIATRAYFPAHLGAAVRQKTRWVHGIALQGWDRLGWSGGLANCWMQLRDRRGPFAALLLATAYLLIVINTLRLVLEHFGKIGPMTISNGLEFLLWANFASLVWRVLLRAVFTTREHGLKQGLLAVPRVVVSNTIAIIAGRRALFAYARTLAGSPAQWDKTDHSSHPARPAATQVPA